ncbi:hypothetical protein ONA91_39860 [Micromonospora sp. DR5-3]|uniref:hypothetical protein n=1 Tax=unclassified Micromonospora TaxID=2617518 RepID=UPI0011DA3BBC|nr:MULTISPECIES: hypothetical protein [unclassified Micromonospora]MCW3820606.1 hypothetical protein [Micromonospora sp. DR5-3]TYC19072.1 hypothetical protein FXF52_38595 [Micromonospora sp. MP36]
MRRTALTAALLLAAATLAVPSGPALAGSPPPGTVTDLGPASEVTSVNGAELVDGTIYTATGGVSPIVLGGYDLAAQRVTKRYELPTGGGAWATTEVGTDLYVGTYEPGDLYRVDTTGTAVTKVADVSPDRYIWALDTAPDGVVYGGTYPGGRVFSYDPATGTQRDYGVAVPGEQYVRSIAVDATTIYAGVGAHAHLIAIDRVTGAKREILPPEFADRTFVGTLALENGVLAAALSPTGTMLLIDTADPSRYEVVQTPDSFITAIAIDVARNDVYVGTRPSGTLRRYDRDTKQLSTLAVPYDGASFGRIFVTGDQLRGVVTNSVVTYDLTTGELTGVDLTQAGMPPAPELAMAIATDGPRVYVSGKAGVQVHDLVAGTSTRRFLPGEAKAMTPIGGEIWMSVYTLAYLFRMTPDGAPRRVTAFGNEQTRPLDATWAPSEKLLVVGTEPDYGRYGGAVALYDPRSGALDVHRDVIADQSIRAVAVKHGTAYLGSSVNNGLGTTPRATEARLAGFDLATRTKTWETVPVPGAKQIVDLVATGNRVYGLTDTGVLFAFDPATRQVVATTTVRPGAGTLVQVGSAIYGTTGKDIWQLDPATMAVRPFVTGLDAEWYAGSALLTAAPDGSALYALRGRDLVRIQL